jgi:hypothetical protein
MLRQALRWTAPKARQHLLMKTSINTDELGVVLLLWKFLVFCGAKKFITVSTTAHHGTLLCAS